MRHAALKYLFEAVYTDGNSYAQDEHDVSLIDSSRSAFYDIDPDRVAQFIVRGQGRTFLVDLEDGHFEVDGAIFWLDDRAFEKRRLIYFRRMNAHLHSDGSSDTQHVCTAIGWQANDEDGKNVKHIMYID